MNNIEGEVKIKAGSVSANLPSTPGMLNKLKQKIDSIKQDSRTTCYKTKNREVVYVRETDGGFDIIYPDHIEFLPKDTSKAHIEREIRILRGCIGQYWQQIDKPEITVPEDTF